jgi:hypothetical protein
MLKSGAEETAYCPCTHLLRMCHSLLHDSPCCEIYSLRAAIASACICPLPLQLHLSRSWFLLSLCPVRCL